MLDGPEISISEGLLTLVVVRFFLISRCTHRAHAAFYLIEKLELSFQSIMFHGKFVHEARASEANLIEIGRHMAGH